MDQVETIALFNDIYIGDSLVQRVELRIADAECHIVLNAGKLLKRDSHDIFDPAMRFEPASLNLVGVRSIRCEGGPYQLNSTVVDFGAQLGEVPGYIEFYLTLTGGTDPDAFMITIKILAKHFEFGPTSL